MNTAHIKKYAPIARNAFIESVTKRAQELGIYSETKISEAEVQGDTLIIEGRSLALAVKAPRERLIKRVQSVGFNAFMEQIAYTWFNRLCAIRYMELHDYLNHGLRVLSPSPSQGEGWGEGGFPEILEHAQAAADELGLDREQVIALKLAGNQGEALYRLLLLGQCHALHQAMPFLFEAIDDETELLLPDKLTRTDSILRGLVDDIPAQDWEQVEVIGWLYQFYISEKKDQVIGKVVKSEDIPAATQLFTPNWIVKYMLQNSLGRHWLTHYPESPLKNDMEYYVDSAAQNPVGWVSDSVTQHIEAENVGLRDKAANPTYTLSDIYAAWQTQNHATILEMQRLEQENNCLFIDAYGLQDELTPEVPLEQITLTVNPKYRYGGKLSDADLNNRFQSDTLAELISYAIGCMMGRYSLDKAGLVYAHSGNVDFDTIYHQNVGWVSDSVTQQIESSHVGLRDEAANPSYLNTFAPDADGILPLTDQEWFKDDVTQRLRDFIRVAFADPAHPDSDHLQANLDFIAQSLCLYALKPKSGEASLDTIRRYLCTQFYKDHLKTYKKRPIYWLFSSGKNKAFECLVYLHRYNESTLARMRTEYVTPLLGKYTAHAEQLQKQSDDASSTAEASRYKKALTALGACPRTNI